MSRVNTNENVAQSTPATKLLLAAEKTFFEQVIAEVRLKYQECWDCKNCITIYNEKDGVYDLPYKPCSCEEV